MNLCEERVYVLRGECIRARSLSPAPQRRHFPFSQQASGERAGSVENSAATSLNDFRPLAEPVGKKSIPTAREIHTVTNKGHSCSSALGAARGGILGGLVGVPLRRTRCLAGVSPYGSRRPAFPLRRNPQERHRKSQSNDQRCKLEPYKAWVTFSLLSNKRWRNWELL